MVLAAFGSAVDERTLEAEARKERGGTRIDEVERLARHHGLREEIPVMTVEDLRRVLAKGKWPIVYLDRAVFEMTPRQRSGHRLRQAVIHVVIPTRVTEASVTYHDPLPPRVTRRSIPIFEHAYGILGNHCVICSFIETLP